MVAELRTAVLFDGYRGAPTVSRAALADLAVRIGALADDLPEVAELDLNPVICHGENLLVVDARVRVAVATTQAGSAAAQPVLTVVRRTPAAALIPEAGGASDVFLPRLPARPVCARRARPGVGRTGNRRRRAACHHWAEYG